MIGDPVARSPEERHFHPRFVPVRSGDGNDSPPAMHQPPQKVAMTAYPPEGPKPRLLDQVRAAIRARHYSLRTEEAYVQWIKRFIFFHGK